MIQPIKILKYAGRHLFYNDGTT